MIKEKIISSVRKNLFYLAAISLMLFTTTQMFGLKRYVNFSLEYTRSSVSTVIGGIKQTWLRSLPTVAKDKCLLSLDQFNQQLVPERLIIPDLGINLPIVSVPLQNGSWPVSDNTANFAEGTSLINAQGGNVGLFGHDRAKVLSNLKKIITGNEIVIVSGEYRAKYQVTETNVVEPKAVDIFNSTPEPTLTLVTCDGKFSEKRFVVRANLISIEKAYCD